MGTQLRFRVATYNIHKCRGMDRRVRPERIVEVLREVDADIIALQEVLSVEGKKPEEHQAEFIAGELGYLYQLGETRKLRGGAYGNVTLTRFPLLKAQHFDLSVPGREPRGCLRTDVAAAAGHTLHVYNVHLGTSLFERRHQAHKLVAPAVISNGGSHGSRIMLGDFNEWTRGLATQMLTSQFAGCIRNHIGRARTYPGFLPFLHLDHIYFDGSLQLDRAHLHRSRLALVASDHLPIVADFVLVQRET